MCALFAFCQPSNNVACFRAITVLFGLYEDMRNRVLSCRCTLVQRWSKWFILAKEIQPKCGSWPRPHAAVTAVAAIHSHCGFPNGFHPQEWFGHAIKCAMGSPSVRNGIQTSGICVSKPKHQTLNIFQKPRRPVFGLPNSSKMLIWNLHTGHGIGDWNLGTCGQRKERRGALRMMLCWKLNALNSLNRNLLCFFAG